MSASLPPATPRLDAEPCPRCGVPATGKFCASCGAPREGARCGGCGSQLTGGAHFCHRCGLAAGAAPIDGRAAGTTASPGGVSATALPWAVAMIALLAVIALVAGQRFAASRGGGIDGSRNALPQAGIDFPAGGGMGGAGGPGAALGGGEAPRRAPDISQMSGEERALRLYNRVIGLSEQGKRDSVMFFAPMAVTAFQMLDSLTLDQRYDLGRIAEVSGAVEIARAQADTILRAQPTHLLGLILAANSAGMRGDPAALRDYQARFLAARGPELARGLEEYTAHRADIAAATTAAQGAR